MRAVRQDQSHGRPVVARREDGRVGQGWAGRGWVGPRGVTDASGDLFDGNCGVETTEVAAASDHCN